MLNKNPNLHEMAKKKLVFWRNSQRVGRSLVIVNKSLKETENLIFNRKNTAIGVYSG